MFNRLRSRGIAFTHDLLMVPVAWLGAYWLRFNLEAVPTDVWRQTLLLLPVVWVTQGVTFWYFGLYRGIWRFASMPDLVRILKAVVLGVAVSAVVVFLWNRLEGVPRSVFVLDAVLLAALLGGPRLFYRWIRDRHLYAGDGKRALIVGAGRAGEMLVRDLLRDVDSPYRPVAFIDDDTNKIGRELHGVPVSGPCADIPSLAEQYGADLILIALPSADSRALRRIVEICEKTGLPFRALPPMKDLVSGKVGIKELREVTIDDLLGRAQVELDWETVGAELNGKTVLVTGGGGSIGSELCRQIAKLGPRRLVVYDQSEYNLYEIDLELRQNHPSIPLISVLGDVQDETAVAELFGQCDPDIVFHAAAYKHVPMLENQVRAAIQNNVVGTGIVAVAAAAHGCASFVLVSTDKAVNPTNIMGATKRAAEVYCGLLAEQHKTRFITVRFGNVLDSAGSVIPLFRRQIARGGPVTVTHPEIERFFMTIPEAAQLILQASAIGRGGEVFVLDMGEPVRIAYLAEQMIRLSGKIPNEDIDIVFTGLRPGEKMYEELFYSGENLKETSHPKILLAQKFHLDNSALNAGFDEIFRSGSDTAEDEQKRRLFTIVPEYRRAKQWPGEQEQQGSANVVPLKAEKKLNS